MRRPAFLFIAVLLGILAATRLAGLDDIPVAAGLAAFGLALAASFVRGTDALYIIVFAMLFSPEIGTGLETGRTAGEGAVVAVRLEDLLLLAVGIGWILRTAYRRRQFGIMQTGVNAPMALFMAVSVLSTLLGVLADRVRPPTGFFHNLKLFEYFFLFYMILAHVRDRKTIRGILLAMFVAFFMALSYGYVQIGTGMRVVAPFDREPNTFGGYIVLMTCVALGVAMRQTSLRAALPYLLLAGYAMPPLLFTLSRASYLALLFGLAAFLVVGRHRLLVGGTMAALAAALALGLPLAPAPAAQRVVSTFEPGRQYQESIAGVDLDPSASARIVSYRRAVERWIERPLLGHGATGTHFIDGQFFRLLAETGVAGLAAFLFLMGRLLAEVRRAVRDTDDPFFRGTGLGLFCGIVAMLGHALAANSFIIIRIAEPLWMMAGLILLVPRIGMHRQENGDRGGRHGVERTLPACGSSGHPVIGSSLAERLPDSVTR